MKLSDFTKVDNLIGQKQKLEKSIERIGDDLLDAYQSEDYYCCISKHSDGSGDKLDLGGCYVGGTVMEATLGILKTKLSEVESELQSLGVEVEEDDNTNS